MTAPFTSHEAEVAAHFARLLDDHIGMVIVASDRYSPAREWLFDPWRVLEELTGREDSPLSAIEVVADLSTEGVTDPEEIAEIWISAIMEEPGEWWVPVTDDGVPDEFRIPREAL